MLERPSVFESVPRVRAAFTTRQGGVSEGPFRSLNMGLSTGDDSERVRENRRVVTDRLGFEPEHLAVAGQVHGSRVEYAEKPGLYRGFDGLVTDRPNRLLAISSADCAAVLLADRAGSYVGGCHAGWRGAVAGIVQTTVRKLQDLGAEPSGLHAYVSPCISVEAFEVGEEVAERFEDRHVVRRSEWRRPHVDLKRALRDRLLEAGLSDYRIEIASGCTVGESDRYFSYRAHGENTGRMMGLIGVQDR